MSLSARIKSGTLRRPLKAIAVEEKPPELSHRENNVKFETTEGEPIMFNEGSKLDEKLNELSQGLADIIGGEIEAPFMERKKESISERLRRQEPLSVREFKVMEPEPVREQKQNRHYLFVSDQSITKEIKCHIDGFNMLKSYNHNFINRRCEDLLRAGINHIWININDTKARAWLELNLLDRGDMIAVLVYSSNKYSKFLDDLEKHCDIKSKIGNLKKLNSLSLEDMMSQLAVKIDIHSPPGRCSPLLSLIGCNSNVKKNKPLAY